ncbi:MAG TPA: cupin domain-containing protein [Thermoleophilaceae bacterium]|jgi:quercetin dioxygenase-like cupin family protein|nr:cupin domain-containing protein [Thermoleophilaceae bacterium]
MSTAPRNIVQVALGNATVNLSAADWKPDVPGIRVREREINGRRWALVEYAPGARRDEWCHDGHLGVVLNGQIEYEFDDGGERVVAAAGDAFTLSTGRGHRGVNRAEGVTTVFLIDDAVEP